MTHRLNNHVRLLTAAALALALGVAGPFSRTARAATPQEVDKAVAKAQAYIWSQMKGNNWEISPVRDKKAGNADVTGWQWGGVSACAVYALLAAGERPVQNPKLAAAMDWLMKAEIYGNYAVGIRCQVYPFLNEKELSDNALPYRAALVRDFQFLLKGIHTDGAKKRGFYPYYVNERGIPLKEHYDLSVSQYGVLGMWACEQAGMEVPNSYWALVDDSWKKAQMKDGGWKYNLNPDQQVKATMTAAGVATLFITQDYMMRLNKWDRCVGGAPNDNLDRGLAWMDRHIDELLKRGNYYAMYGVERIGVASGRKYFGVHDWYEVGADWLVKHQGKDGAWGEDKGNHNPRKIPDTMFAVLFLTRGRAPVVMNKLEYDLDGVAARPAAPAGKPTTGPAPSPTPRPAPAPVARGKTVVEPWNQRPRDAANFTNWAMKRSERFLNWQIVNLDVASKDLHDAPVMYIAGSEPLNFAKEEVQKLKEFVEDGGMILANSDCGDAQFSRSFIALGQAMFPYKFRDLPENHSIFTDQQFKAGRWQGKRPLLQGLSNGTRELMILIPQHDLARWWQNGSYKTKEEMYEVMQNIALYASDKAILDPSFSRGTTNIVTLNPKVKADKPVKVARVMLDAKADTNPNTNPEPGAWRRMAILLHNDHKIKLDVEEVKLGDGRLAASGAKVAHLTGTGAFALTPAQQKDLKDFVARNGALLVDAAGGSSEFADAAEQQLAAVFGGQPGSFGAVLEPTHPVYRQKANPIDRFDYRTFARGKMTGKSNAPRVRGIEQGGRVQVYFSREDLTTGMVGMPVDGILGYDPKTATGIVRNIVLLASGHGGGVAPVGAPATGPTTAPAVAKP